MYLLTLKFTCNHVSKKYLHRDTKNQKEGNKTKTSNTAYTTKTTRDLIIFFENGYLILKSKF